MTNQEREQSRPRTEADQAAERLFAVIGSNSFAGEAVKEALLAERRAARTEGRQQAVREIPMDRERLAAALEACMYRDLRYRNLERQVQRISDEYDARGVAGLNASEHASERAHESPLPPEVLNAEYEWVGDASEHAQERAHESPPHRPEEVAVVEEQVRMLQEGVPNIHRRLGDASDGHAHESEKPE